MQTVCNAQKTGQWLKQTNISPFVWSVHAIKPHFFSFVFTSEVPLQCTTSGQFNNSEKPPERQSEQRRVLKPEQLRQNRGGLIDESRFYFLSFLWESAASVCSGQTGALLSPRTCIMLQEDHIGFWWHSTCIQQSTATQSQEAYRQRYMGSFSYGTCQFEWYRPTLQSVYLCKTLRQLGLTKL